MIGLGLTPSSRFPKKAFVVIKASSSSIKSFFTASSYFSQFENPSFVAILCKAVVSSTGYLEIIAEKLPASI